MCFSTWKSFGLWTRIICALGFIVGVIQFSFGAKSFHVITNSAFGAWWAGVCLCLGVLYGFIVANNMRSNSGCLIATIIISLILLLAGAILDGIGFAVTNKLEACANTNYDTYGNSDYYAAALGCVYDNTNYDCSCVYENLSSLDDNNNEIDCFLFNVQGDSMDCDPILTSLPSSLQQSYSWCIVGFLVALIFSITLCNVSCKRMPEDENQANEVIAGSLNNPMAMNPQHPSGMQPAIVVVQGSVVPTVVQGTVVYQQNNDKA